MELDINQDLKKRYEEALFDLGGYKSENIKSSINKISAHCSSLELRLSFAQELSVKQKTESESLNNLIFIGKYSKSTLKGSQKDWFVKGMTLFMDGYSFDGMFFRKGKEKLFFKSI